MIPSLHIGSELRRFRRSKLGSAALVAICLMPLLYSTLYLWSFWDPFGKLNQLPIALVNEDKGAVVSGEELHAGDEVENGLMENKRLTWQSVSEQDAIDGVRSGDFYFAVTLPEDFSEAVGSPNTDNPRKAAIVAHYNDANGWLSTLIGQNAMREVLNTVSERIGTEAVNKILVGVVDASHGIGQAADGARKIDDGANELHTGLEALNNGTVELHDGLQRNKAGTTQLVEGTGQLRDGASQLIDGTRRLDAEVNKSLQPLQDLAGSVSAAHPQVEQAAATQGQAASDVRDLAASLRKLPDPGSMEAARQLDVIAERLDTEGIGPRSPLKAQLDQINADAVAAQQGNYRGKLGELINGIKRLTAGAKSLGDGIVRLDDGATQLDDGATQLLDGANRLHDGASRAFDGTTRLTDGTHELATKLTEASDAAPAWSPDHRRSMASTIGGPVEVHEYNDGGQNTFGSGLAPFFFSLALYIGGIITFLLLRPLQARAVASGVSGLRAAIDGLLPGALIAVIQGIVVCSVTVLAVPLNPSTFFGLLIFTILTALVFCAINQMLVVALGPGPGRVTTMALLMVQILGSGGLYPVETEPGIWRFLHPLLPMTYTVNGFRQTLYGDFDARMMYAVVALLVILALCLTVTTLCARRNRTWSMKRLHPPIDV